MESTALAGKWLKNVAGRIAQISSAIFINTENYREEQVLVRSAVKIHPGAPGVRFVGLSFSPPTLLLRKQNNSIKGLSLAPLAMFFTSLMMIQNIAPLNVKPGRRGGPKFIQWENPSVVETSSPFRPLQCPRIAFFSPSHTSDRANCVA